MWADNCLTFKAAPFRSLEISNVATFCTRFSVATLRKSALASERKAGSGHLDRASLNIENTARSSASAGAFTFGWVGWVRHFLRLPA
jgi:hypothetical protein